MCVTPVENPVCISFEEYEDMPEIVSLEFTEDEVPRVASMLSGAAGALGAETIELHNWFLHLGCASEELRVVVDRIADWMANSSPPWAAYHALIAFFLVAFDKSPVVHPVVIGETLFRYLPKLVMRASGDQARMACVNFQLCAGL